MSPEEAEMDRLLRRSLAAPVPSLRPDFDQRFRRELRQGSRTTELYGRWILPCYGLLSVVTSAVVMRGEGLGWGSVSMMILGPLALVAAVPWVRSANHRTMRHGSR
jgi:hypothetical protein